MRLAPIEMPILGLSSVVVHLTVPTLSHDLPLTLLYCIILCHPIFLISYFEEFYITDNK